MAAEGRGPPDPHPGPHGPDHPGPHGPDFDVHSYHDGYLDWMGFVIALIILIVVVKVIILICWLCGRNRHQGYVRLQGGAGNTYHATDTTSCTYAAHPTPYPTQPSAPPPYQNPYQAKDFTTMATAPPAYTAENTAPPPYSLSTRT